MSGNNSQFCDYSLTEYQMATNHLPTVPFSTDMKLSGFCVPVQRCWLVFDICLLLFILNDRILGTHV